MVGFGEEEETVFKRVADALNPGGYSMSEVIKPEDVHHFRALFTGETEIVFHRYLHKLSDAFVRIAADCEAEQRSMFVGMANAYLSLADAFEEASKEWRKG